jgi:excinuclease UvrABC ATPase subunit
MAKKTARKLIADTIRIRGARQNNLKGIDLDLPLGQLSVITGPSGSGKSSLAFDTIYAEGQRRYVETFSPYTRQFFERMDKPKVDSIEGIPPAIAIEQVNNMRSTRSTVGTITEINDYLKMIFPRLAEATCPGCNRPVKPETPETILHDLLTHHTGSQALILFPVPVPKNAVTADFAAFLQSQGFLRLHLYGQTLRLDELGARKLPAQVLVVQDRLTLEAKTKSRLSESLEAALRHGKGHCAVSFDQIINHQSQIINYSTDWSCADCSITLPTPTPGLFSFNSPLGACPTCKGFGRTLGIDIGKAIPDESLSINLGLVRPFQSSSHGESQLDLERAARKRGIDIHKPFDDYTADERDWLLNGTCDDPELAYNRGEWYGVRGFFKWMESRSYKMHVRVFLSRYRAYTECAACDGGRLKKEAYAFRIGSHTIADLWRMPVSDLHPLVQSWPLKEGDHAATMLRDEIASRVSYMDRAGLGYLNLDRQTRTLSGGELQRVNLTTCLGASLVNTLFVLDEPSIGLHPRDIGRLIGVMHGLRDKGNTLLVVEHEEAVMHAADNLIDIGPGRGEKGGELVFNGPLEKLSKTKGSLTGDYLFGRKNIPVPTQRRPVNPVNPVNTVTEKPLDLPTLSDDESRRRAYKALLQQPSPDSSLRDRSRKAASTPHPCAEELHRSADQESFGWSRRQKRERLLDDQLAILNRHATAPADLGTHIGGGGEHEVYHQEGSQIVHKITNRGEFGYVIDQDSDNKSNKLALRHALPSEYLLRLGTQNLLFGDTIRVEAIQKEKGKTASIVTSQSEVDLGRPSQDEVNAFMTQCGFVRVPDDMMLSQYSNKFFWYRASDSVLTGDTNPENFSKADDHNIVPIDVIAHPYPRSLFEATAKQNGIPLTHFQPKPSVEPSRPNHKSKIVNHKFLSIRSARQNNLRKLDADIPLNTFVCITGVSGSGKSTLVHDVLYRNLQKLRGEVCEEEPGRVGSISGWEQLGSVVMVDQSPLARTPRSTPAVFVGAFDHIRTLFAACDDAATQGIMPGFFSFNSGEGRCERCMGNGFEKIEMQFLSDLYVTCPECEGKRYKPHALKILLHGKSIHDVLSLTIDDAVPWFATLEHRAVAAINRSLQLVIDAGLGYLKLGQPLNTLSGGEAQRLKLVGHLLEPQTPGKSSLLLLDEPTTGLHFDDIALLIKLLQRLVDEGNSLVVIEHNLEVIKCADWVLDLGPEGGAAGGNLVIAGTPEEVAACPTSHTGKYLRQLLTPSSIRSIQSIRSPQTKNQEPRTKNTISIRGAREHNLKNISLDIPRDEFVVVTGLSGSGKSSLAFDLIFAEGQRRFLDSMSVYARTFVEQMEKPEVDLITGVPPTVAIEQRISRGGGKSTVATVTEVYHFLRLLFAKLGTQHCPQCAVPVKKQSAEAILKTIQGHLRTSGGHLLAPLIKARKGFHTDVAENAAKHGIETLWVDGEFKPTMGFKRLERFKEHSIDAVIAKVAKGENADVLRPHIETALKMGKGTIKLRLADKTMHVLSTEMSCPSCGLSFEELDPRLFSFNSPHGWCKDCRGFGYVGAKRDLHDRNADVSMLDAVLYEERRFNSDDDENAAPRQLCSTCHGSRINEIGRAVQLQKSTIQDFANLTAGDASKLIAKLKFDGTEAIIARDIVTEITQRLKFMQEVGLGYLQLNRSADTLSGGEAQRIRLSAQLGSNLRGVLYVLDEPTIGLHPRDNEKLLNTLVALRDKGNSLLVVEHDDETMKRADTILDLGPGAGKFGGEIVAQGTLAHLLKSKQSVTGQSLKHPLRHPSRGSRRPLPSAKSKDGWLRVTGATANNLQNIDVSIPLARLTVLTGVSGSGKSSFMHGALSPAVREKISKAKIKVTKAWKSVSGFENLQTVHEVDQSPIGKTSRSCPATYVGILDDIRALFAQVPLARTRGYTASRFSFNTEGGRCETCCGNGEIKVEMAFLPTTRVHCETCHGLRFNAATLEIEYNNKHIGDVLRMSITEAAEFFAPVQKIARPLKLLADTGLGYLQLGQPSPTLSGGEAQRIKLVTELRSGDGKTIKEQLKGIQKAGKRNLYLIEEPTIGLHIRDVARLIDVLHRLVDEGHTVVVIEHHPDVYAEADYLIDIGPEAGPEGGQLVAAGTPEEVKKSKVSRTARFL